jgi:hypothetical protein
VTSYLYGYSSPPLRLSLAELEGRLTWRGLDPEFRRRLVALFDACNGTVGIGGGWRSAAQQEALFRSRYTAHSSPPGTEWLGMYWRLKPGMAPSTPPGRSYHEDTTPGPRPGSAIAADLIGDLDAAHRLASWYGLRDLANVNNEPWHFQPIEVPTARRDYTGAPLKAWTFPNQPTPTPPQETDVRYLRVHVPGDATRAEALVMLDMKGFNTPAERDAVSRVLDVEDRPVSASVYDALKAVYTA